MAGAQNMWVLFLRKDFQYASLIWWKVGTLQSIRQHFVWCYFRTCVRLTDGSLPASNRLWHLCTSDLFFAAIWHTDLHPRIKIGGDPGPRNWRLLPRPLRRHPPPPSDSSHFLRLPLSLNIFFPLPCNFRIESISLFLKALVSEELVWPLSFSCSMIME